MAPTAPYPQVLVTCTVVILMWKALTDEENLKGGVHQNQLDRRDFTTPVNYNVSLLTSIRVLLLADVHVESDYSLVHFAVL